MSDQTPSTPEKKSAEAAEPAAGGGPAREGMPPPPQPKAAQPKAGTKAHKYIQDKVHVWPHLTRLEFLAAIAATLILTVWSITIDAPLEEPANPARTPNPSKAPWYFLGLQEMLVYFDPWIAGVVMPTLIIIGLMVIPYVDPNPKGNGYYTFKERWFAISTFLFGFLILWIALIVLGTFFRGPGWNIFMPWEKWDPHLVVPLNNVDLNEFVALAPAKMGLAAPDAGWFVSWKGFFLNRIVAAAIGLVAVGGFFGISLKYFGWMVGLQERMWKRYWKTPGPMLSLTAASLIAGVVVGAAFGDFFPSIMGNASIAVLVLTAVFVGGFMWMDRGGAGESATAIGQRFYNSLGAVRFYTVGLLYVSMLGLVAKMILRLGFNIKYIVVLPWINANI